MKKLPTGIDIIKGKHPGPCVVIMGSVHGNEGLGGAVIANLCHGIDQNALYGDLIFILGNPVAFAASRRFIDCDLNRIFGNDFKKLIKKPCHTLNTEEKRAIEIAPFLQRADYLLDIHSTIKPSIPFVYTENTKQHLDIASLFDTEYVVSPGSGFRPPDIVHCADNFVDRNGGIGITYEEKWHSGQIFFLEVIKKIHRFLAKVGSIEEPLENKIKKQFFQLLIYDYLIPKTPSFRFKKNYENFDIVHANEVIAEDNKKIIKARKDSFIIFPKIDLIIGSPACYLATK